VRIGVNHSEAGHEYRSLAEIPAEGGTERPLSTSEELKAPEIEFEKLCSTGFTHEQMSAKHWRLKTSEILIEVFGQ
jgi:hypothetical protein